MVGVRCYPVISTFKSSKTESKQILGDGRDKDVNPLWIKVNSTDVAGRYHQSRYPKPSTKVLLEAEIREKM